MMHDLVALMQKNQQQTLMGETDLVEQLGHPLKLSYVVILIGLAGCASININLKKYPIRPHDIVVLYDDSFALPIQRSKHFKVFYCMIDKALAAEIAYQLPNQLFSFLQDSPRCIVSAEQRLLLSMWLAQTRAIYSEQGRYQAIMLRNHLQNFFLEIAAQMPSSATSTHPKLSRKEQLCWRFWEMIGQHCQQHREVAFYATQLSITPYYLAQISKAIFNDSPKDLIHRQVTLEMKTLLLSTTLSIQQIADQLHFADPAYMCRYFKRQTGISLSQYRRQGI